MAEFTFNLSQVKGAVVEKNSSSTFTITGPEGMTQEQAFEIFKKQVDTGALVGFKPGDGLSAATQAANGLASAQATLAQAQSTLTGTLGAGLGSVAGIGSISKSLGAAGGAAGGSLAATSPGLTGIVGPAVSSISGAINKGINSVVSSVTSIVKQGTALVQSAIKQNSVAVTSVQTINKTLTTTPVTNPINAADVSKVVAGVQPAGAVSSIGPMSVPEVNGVLAQAKNLVGQASNALSNTKGLGSFGLSIGQLESAGYVKPGTKALLAAGSNLFADVAKSPAIWTGKDGVKSATDLLNNPAKQSLIQQDLMTKGVAALGAVGVPVKNLSSQGIAGMSLNAAKDLPSAEAFVKNLPIPNDPTGTIKAAMSTAVRAGAFAVNLVTTKLPAVFKQQETPKPAADTVNRGTINAAATRVVGNDKVPPPNYGNLTAPENPQDIEDYKTNSVTVVNDYLNVFGRSLEAVSVKLSALEAQQTITQAQYDAILNEWETAKTTYNAKGPKLVSEVLSLYARLSIPQQKVADALPTNALKISSVINYVLGQSKSIKERLQQVSLKIEGRGEGE